MAILTVAEWQERAGFTVTGTDLTAATDIVASVCAAIIRMANGNVFERATYTNLVIDAPWNSRFLTLPQWPVASITNLYLNWNAKGDSSAFDATADLLTNFTDYRLVIDDFVLSLSKRGKVEILTRPYWAMWQERPYGMLTTRPRNCPGCVKTTFVAGYSSLPDDLIQAAAMATTLLYHQRRTGMPVTSSSWNGRSVSYDGAYTAASALKSAGVWDLLAPYVNRLVIA